MNKFKKQKMKKKLIHNQLGYELRVKSWDNLDANIKIKLVGNIGQKINMDLDRSLWKKIGHKIYINLRNEIGEKLNEAIN
jgi:hypothetical protein